MHLKYVGLEPHISQHGISFDINKEDKYVYLHIVIQLLKALNHEYFEDKTYIYSANTNKIDEQKLAYEISKFCPDINTLINAKSHTTKEEIQE